MKLEGFVITPPVSPGDDHNREYIESTLGYPTFGTTATEAWVRRIGYALPDPGEFSALVRRWHDRGYRLKKAIMEIQDE